MAFRRSSTTRGILGFLSGLGLLPLRKEVLTASSCRFQTPLWVRGRSRPSVRGRGHGGATVANWGEMYDPEVDLRLDPPRAGSHAVTYGELLR
jgi:hypothetical protein